ncbi:hypothetical protein HX866_12735 [Pseudomonas gingeri]|uniref:hypothetical protein n=1 Tax=Pseudomonas gingeri TaxID=117681 RepID=UPI0015A0ACC5|nr:hypothetical protein [Pseudomonas gingeri]NWA25757.1 hypothetical protein [Pseudomonas gingeri]
MKTTTKVFLGLAAAGLAVGAYKDISDRGPSEPDYPASATAAQKASILLEHRIKRSDRELVEVRDGGDALTIVYRPRDSHDGEGWTKRVLMSAQNALTAIHEARPEGVSVVVIQAQIPVSTPGGPTTYSNGLYLTYNWSDLQTLDWSKWVFWDAGNLPRDISFRRFGLEAALEYCATGSNATNVRIFCQRAEAAR